MFDSILELFQSKKQSGNQNLPQVFVVDHTQRRNNPSVIDAINILKKRIEERRKNG